MSPTVFFLPKEKPSVVSLTWEAAQSTSGLSTKTQGSIPLPESNV